MFKNNIEIVLIANLLLLCNCSKAQPQLEQYIHIVLLNNETIKQKEFELNKSLYSLKEAKSLFLPTVAFDGTYTLAGGGRSIDVPIGDLLNTTYKTLNQLTNTSNFSQVNNQSILLNPNNFYDAKLHTAYPVYNAELQYNKKIKTQQYNLQQTEINLYKRELIKEIKTAYFSYLQAGEAVHIYETALTLVKENLRINTLLFKNDKVNRTAVTRADNEVIKYSALIETAKQNLQNAKAFFNFLLNANLSSNIITDSIYNLPFDISFTDTNVSKREELLKLKQVADINKNVVNLTGTYKVPKLNAFADVGAQDFRLAVNNNSFYYLAGISLEWNLFAGNKNKYRQQQAEEDNRIIASQTSNAEQQLKLQLIISINAYKSAVVQYTAAQSQVNTLKQYYSDELKLYKEGQALFIELLDAQNQLITAKLQLNISLFDVWIKAADIERANAGFNLQ